MQGVIPQPEIAEILGEHFVGLAADADAPEEEVVALGIAHLADAMMLPFVMLVDGDGRWLGGGSGAVAPEPFKEQLLDAVAEAGRE